MSRTGLRDQPVNVVISTSVRVDSLAYVACSMLFPHRKPRICYQPMVTTFASQYRLPTTLDDVHAVRAMPQSTEEHELVQFLEFIGHNTALNDQFRCVEAVALDPPPVHHQAEWFGCFDANASEFVGFEATRFASSHREFAWLTIESINAMGFADHLRHHAISSIDQITPTAFRYHRQVNFSSHGVMYTWMIAIDTILMVMHALSHWELLQTKCFWTDALTSVVPMPLYRSIPMVALTVVSQWISWPACMLPHVILSTHAPLSSLSSTIYGLQPMLSSVRVVWISVLCILRLGWHAVVWLNEAMAYRITKHTFISMLELVVCAALACTALGHADSQVYN